ncbi:GNAT family N-acetyltransferase [Flavobacterium sp. L1I52]|uniref:GNAT family N-acetyltransferase n=1 Tax=Flavobacterium pokkalii TaxID=1940408 RepID=A0ABR7UTN0_9FLAO|nr:GNAT family N-acetyltransferase [Flavobacterium pokkalii]MBD0725997.1 GNAT family N-acetyltransferase [Flavobacterium pokkalii]
MNNSITITKATVEDLKTISTIAYKTWPITYGEILSETQLSYMLEAFYSDAALLKNMENGHEFILAYEDGIALGFASFEHQYQNKPSTKIHKIYMLPESQGKGVGKLLIDTIEKMTLDKGCNSLLLNVNRFNKAIGFYQKMGFQIIQEIDIEIGLGYLMEDYVMEKKLS